GCSSPLRRAGLRKRENGGKNDRETADRSIGFGICWVAITRSRGSSPIRAARPQTKLIARTLDEHRQLTMHSEAPSQELIEQSSGQTAGKDSCAAQSSIRRGPGIIGKLL